ncbi:twin-arginine translocation signal domain-containing protein [Albidovulum salinarum]|uniref:twin-arginine translocation signal domain-containing protein n=1 Tax=Albidovulum salinarum TaxID=2984153 RepID=UPI0039892575
MRARTRERASRARTSRRDFLGQTAMVCGLVATHQYGCGLSRETENRNGGRYRPQKAPGRFPGNRDLREMALRPDEP